MRADAVAKRQAILDAAWRLFADEGTAEISMRTVASAAGVGMGTLYRHFPSREELLFGIGAEVHRRVQLIVAEHRDGWDTDPEAVWASFVAAMAALRLGALGPRLAASLQEGILSPEVVDLRTSAVAEVADVLDRAAAAGMVPSTLEPMRFNIAVSALTRRLPEPVLGIVPGQHEWALEVFLTGLRAQAAAERAAG